MHNRQIISPRWCLWLFSCWPCFTQCNLILVSRDLCYCMVKIYLFKLHCKKSILIHIILAYFWLSPCWEQLWDKSISHGFHDLQLCAVFLAWLRCLEVYARKCMVFLVRWNSHHLSPNPMLVASDSGGIRRLGVRIIQLWDKSISHGFHDLQLCAVFLAWLRCLEVYARKCMVFLVRWNSHHLSPNPMLVASDSGGIRKLGVRIIHLTWKTIQNAYLPW